MISTFLTTASTLIFFQFLSFFTLIFVFTLVTSSLFVMFKILYFCLLPSNCPLKGCWCQFRWRLQGVVRTRTNVRGNFKIKAVRKKIREKYNKYYDRIIVLLNPIFLYLTYHAIYIIIRLSSVCIYFCFLSLFYPNSLRRYLSAFLLSLLIFLFATSDVAYVSICPILL